MFQFYCIVEVTTLEAVIVEALFDRISFIQLVIKFSFNIFSCVKGNESSKKH